MRKTFLTFCAAALALLAVSSCGKLEDGLNSLKGEVADLKDRVEKLEKKLNDEVQALQATMATLATKQEMNSALTTLKTSLEAKDSELATAIQTVSSTLAGLDAKYVGKSVYDAAMAELADADSDFAEALEALAALLGETEAPVDELLAELAEAIASVTVTVVENEDGNVVITLANGESFTVADPDSNANNTGLVTVDEDGNWAVILEDGTLKSLDAQVGVEELEFSVDYETNELLFSVNGGEPKGTGAYVASEYNYIVEDFWAPNGENFVYITIGGKEYTLVKATESTSELAIKSGKAYFDFGEVQTFDLKSVDLSDLYIMSKPDGWKAVVNGKVLTVTAPVEANIYAEMEGQILLHGTDAEGMCKVAKLDVAATTGIKVVVNQLAGTVTIINSLVEERQDYDYEEGLYTVKGFSSMTLGLGSVDYFEELGADSYIDKDGYGPEETQIVMQNMPNLWDNVFGEELTLPEYKEGVCDVFEMTFNIADLYKALTWGDELEPGSRLVVWVQETRYKGFNMNYGMPEYELGDFVYKYFEPVYVNIEESEVTYNDIELNVIAKNAEKFQIGKFATEDEYGIEFEYLDIYYPERYQSFDEIGVSSPEIDDEIVMLSEFGLSSDEMSTPLKPYTEYTVYVLPNQSKPYNDYDYVTDIEPYVYTFTTKGLVAADGATTAAATLNETKTKYNQIVADITADAGTETIYYKLYTNDQYEANSADNTFDFAKDIATTGYVAMGTYATLVSETNLSPESVYWLMVVAVNEDGEYDGIFEQSYTTPSAKIIDGSVSAEVTAVEIDGTKATVTYKLTGTDYLVVAANVGTARLQANDTSAGKYEGYIMGYGPEYFYLKSYKAENGIVTVVYNNYSASNKYSYAIPYTVSGGNFQKYVPTVITDISTFNSPVEPQEPETEEPINL